LGGGDFESIYARVEDGYPDDGGVQMANDIATLVAAKYHDHYACSFRMEDRKVINAARGLLALATKDALGPMAAADQPDTAADVLWTRLRVLDHIIADRDAAVEKDGQEQANRNGYAMDA
jgi:hypothetical protein